ncbi:MAG: DUF1289 domain-containing protein [Gammaproteobacteria bacterium]
MTELSEIPSPCVRNCCLNNDDICLGCFRSLDEICAWSQLDEQNRLLVLSRADERRRAIQLNPGSKTED